MTEIIKSEPKKVLEPTEILAPGVWGPGGKPGPNPRRVREYHPLRAMRNLGYTRNPDTCRHERKYYSPGAGWSCRDCGERLMGL